MVVHPGAYPWSSYAANVGARVDPLVTHNSEYLAIAADPAVRQAAYRELCEEGVDTDLLKAMREATYGGYPLASERFKSCLALPPGARIERGRPGPRAPQVTKITTLTPN
jgi:putative transposase